MSADKGRVHPFQALLYLKFLCVHPGLVIDSSHGRYRQRLLLDERCSGKMIGLSNLLIDCGVIQSDEYDAKINVLRTNYEDNCNTSQYIDSESDEDDEGSNSSSNSNSNTNANDDDDKTSLKQNDQYHNIRNVPKKPSTRSTIKNMMSSNTSISCSNNTNNGNGIDTGFTDDKRVNRREMREKDVHKCLIFAQHNAVLDIIEEVCIRTLLTPFFISHSVIFM